MTTPDPDRPAEPFSDLPRDPGAATQEIRRRMIDEWRSVLRSTGRQIDKATFGTSYLSAPPSWSAQMTVSFSVRDESQWPDLESALATAVARNGWTQAGVSHGLSVRKGPLFLKGGCSVSTTCTFQVRTARLEDVTLAPNEPGDGSVAELAEFLAHPTRSAT